MSMTREEALSWFEKRVKAVSMPGARAAHEAAIRALRPVSREQLERVWRGEWVGVPRLGVYDMACSKCGFCPGIRFYSSDFCPNCGAPMTDKAVDMMMRRLEALKDSVD